MSGCIQEKLRTHLEKADQKLSILKQLPAQENKDTLSKDRPLQAEYDRFCVES